MRFSYHKIGEKRYEMEENTMKKKLSIVLLSLVMAFNTCGIVGYADDGITVTLNGDKIEFDVQPQLINDRTMVPLRKIFEAMGAYVDWYGDTQTVVATKDDKVVTAKINDNNLYINDEVKTLDVPPMIIDGRTLVPARFVAESFGANVDWDGATQTVVIMTKWNRIGEIPCYKDYPSIPDFGLIVGVPNSADENSDIYSYDTTVMQENDFQYYISLMKNEGWTLKSDLYNIWSLSKDGVYIDIPIWETSLDVVITLPDNQTSSFTDGYTLAEFSKYNSPASQNGLGDTPIYINCSITKTEVMKAGDYQMILGYLKDDSGNQWLAMLNATVFDSESTFKNLVGKNLVFCGVYSGYSDAKNMPVIELAQLRVNDTGDIITGIATLTN